MPVNDLPVNDDPYGTGRLARLMCEAAVADDSYFRQQAEERAPRRTDPEPPPPDRPRNKGGRPRKHRTRRPWQAAGFATRAEWEASGAVD